MPPAATGRLIVYPQGPWQTYAPVIPPGAEILGTVQSDAHGVGALVRLPTGAYCQLNAERVIRLDGRRVASALGVMGRPTEMTAGRRVQVYLDAPSLARALDLGDGNASLGIRRALAQPQD